MTLKTAFECDGCGAHSATIGDWLAAVHPNGRTVAHICQSCFASLLRQPNDRLKSVKLNRKRKRQ